MHFQSVLPRSPTTILPQPTRALPFSMGSRLASALPIEALQAIVTVGVGLFTAEDAPTEDCRPVPLRASAPRWHRCRWAAELWRDCQPRHAPFGIGLHAGDGGQPSPTFCVPQVVALGRLLRHPRQPSFFIFLHTNSGGATVGRQRCYHIGWQWRYIGWWRRCYCLWLRCCKRMVPMVLGVATRFRDFCHGWQRFATYFFFFAKSFSSCATIVQNYYYDVSAKSLRQSWFCYSSIIFLCY
jgi:hypothetical protein